LEQLELQQKMLLHLIEVNVYSALEELSIIVFKGARQFQICLPRIIKEGGQCFIYFHNDKDHSS
jgi:hypothetical protein